MRSASSRTTRKIVGLPAYVIAFHSLMHNTSLDGCSAWLQVRRY
jgi:hypothetical protein